jgi:N-formylglutamate amidohydrolase
MDEFCMIELDSPTPLVTAAIHNGHKLSEHLSRLTALSDIERLREEDPYTGIWGALSRNHIVGQRSRFEFDLNRAPEKAIYLLPSDAWGLNLWKKEPKEEVLTQSLQRYTSIYAEIHEGLSRLIQKFGKIVILDLHTYNHRRRGPGAPPDDPDLNPEVNIGTGTMDRKYWAPLVDRFIGELRAYDFQGRKLDVRENVKFRGGYFPTWVHGNFGKAACCISVEFKKFFMDEWSGHPDWDSIDAISDALRQTLPGLVSEISKNKTILNLEDHLP